MLTKKDFQGMAVEIKSLIAKNASPDFVDGYIRACVDIAVENPNFNAKRFYDACGIDGYPEIRYTGERYD
jgi:hypothetical protein